MGPGGIPQSMSLLQLEEPPPLAGAACAPCGLPQQGQQLQQARSPQ